MRRRLWAICKKEWIQIRRDPRTLAVVWALPLVQLILFGYAMNFDLKGIPIAVLDYDHTIASRALREDFARSEYFRIRALPERQAEGERLVAAGEVRAALVIPTGFARDLRRADPAPVQILLDGADSNTASTALGYTQGVLDSFLETWQREHRTAELATGGIDIRSRILYNPELRSTRFIVPGLIAVLLTMLAALLTSNTVVREKERGTFESLIATPVRPLELMIGKLLPYVALAFGQVVLVVVVGWGLFGVAPAGNLWLLAGLSLIFLLAALSLGLLISTVARTQQLALMAAIISTVLPSLLISGFTFPRRNMPVVLQALSQLLPATHYLVIVRGIYLKGVGLSALWQPVLFLATLGVLLLLACARRFTKQL